MKKTFIILLIVGGLLLLFLVYARYARLQESKLMSGQTEQQRLLLAQQTASSEACSKNWMCATQGVLSGVSGIFSGMFGGS